MQSYHENDLTSSDYNNVFRQKIFALKGKLQLQYKHLNL